MEIRRISVGYPYTHFPISEIIYTRKSESRFFIYTQVSTLAFMTHKRVTYGVRREKVDTFHINLPDHQLFRYDITNLKFCGTGTSAHYLPRLSDCCIKWYTGMMITVLEPFSEFVDPIKGTTLWGELNKNLYISYIYAGEFHWERVLLLWHHRGAMAHQITCNSAVCPTTCSG